MNTLSCIKCRAMYQSEDVDPYLCETCLEQKKAIAAEVDRKLANRPRKVVKSELQIFDEIAKSKGGARNNFVNINDLGIKL